MTKNRIQAALQCLKDNGISQEECPIVLQALCYILLDEEIEDLLTEVDYENNSTSTH